MREKASGTGQSASEMENTLLDNIIVTDDALRNLAFERALTVKKHFTESGIVDTSRIFLIEPRINQDGAKTVKEKSRVEFRLK